jgi:hypothetical protein
MAALVTGVEKMMSLLSTDLSEKLRVALRDEYVVLRLM